MLEAKVVEQSGVPVIVITGEADVTSIEPMERALDTVAAGTPALAVIDLRGLSFITSMGMGALARFSTIVRKQGRVRIVLPAGHVRDVMLRSRVIELFEEAASVNEAIL